MSTAALVLAAGVGRRFSGPGHKLRTPVRGRPLVAWAVEGALESGLDDVFVVVGADDLADVLPAGVRAVVNPAAAEGQATSLACGIEAARAAGHDAVVVGLGDQPGVSGEAWRLVAASASPVATAVFEGARRPPVRLAESVWPLLPTEGDEGARVLLRMRPDLVAEVPCPGDPGDIDTLEDLDRWS